MCTWRPSTRRDGTFEASVITSLASSVDDDDDNDNESSSDAAPLDDDDEDAGVAGE